MDKLAVAKHDAARDHIADCCSLLPPLAANVVAEWRGDGWRADVTALGANGEPAAVVEVIDTHPLRAPPSEMAARADAARIRRESDRIGEDVFSRGKYGARHRCGKERTNDG